ncbi:GNAT family N-acetyltransferase [Streptomyces rapamycinicus]|uniref:N-acetyltransferase GCN5 n=2 Tax=Streptomyces rapamycinicus TaxID=1226757 RepID=A0A0A0NLW8_STRRN|nr:GNAT family protein [Streptomyces rapamycinicus]AGP57929.1 N-acetyltransferase GCN5 [Streptomyces rapamycinicus NRRL 5491]MBB4785599.1 RimJ/RimL family protein N-acetyltransferase [Streptomyces rapamycinicus]RLV78936.1 N-acetyltransferase GCN5 [Streptomyces rapamycinicus NRRL 5491]UTO65769.1 GNAT family N-acetyltransferase [Streptomyces rapamycinicus]UTP33726.1 GNAT family N-acetyltransferase [Streptomyces rapamycinicus NRRL 5491]
MDPHHWPLYGLRLRTPRLELRLPDIPLLDELAAVAAGGVHDPDEMPFGVPWTDAPPEERGRGTFQHVLRTIAEWRPEQWTLSLAVLHEGAVIGRQDLFAAEFAVTREAETGSWLGTAHQGKGLGTEMRAAVAHLAFEGLGALSLISGAMVENGRSLGVSRRLGYRPDGLSVLAVRGEARTLQRLRLDRAAWEEHRATPVEIAGLEPCRALFGAP